MLFPIFRCMSYRFNIFIHYEMILVIIAVTICHHMKLVQNYWLYSLCCTLHSLIYFFTSVLFVLTFQVLEVFLDIFLLISSLIPFHLIHFVCDFNPFTFVKIYFMIQHMNYHGTWNMCSWKEHNILRVFSRVLYQYHLGQGGWLCFSDITCLYRFGLFCFVFFA